MITPHIQPVDNLISLVTAKQQLRVDTTVDDELIKSCISAACDWVRLFEGQSYMVTTYKKHIDRFCGLIELPFPPLIAVDSITYVDTAGVTQTLSPEIYTVDTDSMPGQIYLAYNQSWPTVRDVRKAITITYTTGYSTVFTTAFASGLFTVGNAVFVDGDRVRLTTDSGDLPDGLLVNTDYYVRDVSGSTLKLALTPGGNAITLTDNGTGTHYIGFANRGNVPDRVISAVKLIISHLYEHREEISDFQTHQNPFAAKNLLKERVW